MSQLCISSSKNYLRKNSNLLLQQYKHHSDTAAKRGFLLTTNKTNSSSSLLCWRSFSSVSQHQKGNKSEKKGIDEKSVQDDFLSMDVDELNLSPWRNLLIHPARALWRTSSTTLTRKGIMKLEAEQRDKTKKQKRRHSIKESNSQQHYSVEEKIYLQYRDILKKSNRTKNQLHRTHMKMISHQEKLRESRLIGRKEAERQKHNLLSNDTVIIDGRRKRTTRSLKIAPDSLQATQLRKSQETLLANENFGYNPEHTCVYMKHRLFPNYYIIERVLKELKSLMMSTSLPASSSSSSEEKNLPIIRKVIDFGVGCGSASAAALQVFGSGRAGEQQTKNNNNHNSTSDAANKHKTAQEQQIERLRQFIVRKNNLNINDNEGKEHNSMEEGSIEWIHGIDASRSMREVSEKIINAIIDKGSSNNQSKSQFSSSSSFRFTSGESLTSSSSSIQNSTSTSPTTSTGLGTFDLALFCYTAQELPSTSAVLSSAAILWEKLAPNGYFVMVEPGTPDGFHSVRAVREMLLDCCPPSQSQQKAHSPYFNFGGFENDENVSAATTTVENHVAVEEAHVIAPCTHNSICPLNKFSPIASSNQESDDDDTVESIDDTEDEFNKKELFQDDDDDDIETDWDSGDIRDMMENEEFAIQEMSKELDLLYGDNEKAFDLLRDLQNDELESQDFDSDDDEDENEEDKDNGLNENQGDSTTNTTSKKNKFSLVETTDIFSNGFCSFVHALPATQLNNNRGKVGRKKGEKFSFIILQKRLVPMNSNTQPQTNSYQENKQNMEYDGNTVEESSDNNNNNNTTYSSLFSTSNHDINDENIVDMLAKNIHLGMKYNKGVMEYEKLKRKKNVRLNRRDTIHEHDEEEIAFKMKEKEVKEASDSHVNFFTEIMALEKKKSSNDSSSSMEESNISNKTKKDELGLELVSKARRRSTYYSLNNDDIISTGTSHQEQSNEQEKKKPFYYEQVQPDQNYPWGRLIRSPLKMKGHVMVDYCTGGISQPQLNNDDSSMNDDEVTSTHQESTTNHYQQQREPRTHGRIVRHKVTRAKSDNLSPGLYSAARKARWGGFWPDLSGYEQLMQSDKSASSSSTNSDENVKNKS